MKNQHQFLKRWKPILFVLMLLLLVLLIIDLSVTHIIFFKPFFSQFSEESDVESFLLNKLALENATFEEVEYSIDTMRNRDPSLSCETIENIQPQASLYMADKLIGCRVVSRNVWSGTYYFVIQFYFVDNRLSGIKVEEQYGGV